MYICVSQRNGKIHIVDFKMSAGEYFCVCGVFFSSIKNNINVFSSESLDNFCTNCVLYTKEYKFLNNNFKSKNIFKLQRKLKNNKFSIIGKHSSNLHQKLVGIGIKKR